MGDVRGRLFVPSPRGRSYAEINEWLMDRCVEDAKIGTLTVAQGRVGPPVYELCYSELGSLSRADGPG